MTRAILPGPSVKGVRAPTLDGGGDDDDAYTGTYTTTPDDDSEDIASLTSQQSTSLQLAPLVLLAL